MLLEIAPVADVPACTPSLMPFHISYTGLAPISCYFRPRPTPSPLATLTVRSSSSATLVASSSSMSILSETQMSETQSSLTTVPSATSAGSLTHGTEHGEDALLMTDFSVQLINQVESLTTARLSVGNAMGVDPEIQPAPHVNLPPSRSVERFVAAFRGRQVYGQAVDIPDGYGGLVLRAPKGKGMDDTKATLKPSSQKTQPKSKTHAATRRSRRTTADATAGDPEGRDDEDCCPDACLDPLPPRRLIPSSTFTSFTLWTPDRPLDEGKDEYARALVEWVQLANEIHAYDD